MTFFTTFLGRALSDKDEPSSKRIAGFAILLYAMFMYAWIDKMPIQDLAAWLGASFLCLGISGLEKFTNPKKL